ncbi:MAG: serine/threonine-protein kinase [Planctomycetota bacterium]
MSELARLIPELEDFEPLGRGGMGSVYRARHRSLQRPVAVKVLSPRLSEQPSFASRFAREARTLARLDHPNVVSVYDYGDRDGLCFLVMELVEGVNLRQMIDAKTLTAAEALALVPQICEALQYAHDQGVIHRDVKPENILVTRQGLVKIADFGLAKLIRDEGNGRLTQTEQIMGTPHYMAPEQMANTSNVDHRADIFALGVVFYELLTGELPMGRFEPPSKRVAIDVRLDDVVLRTLEREPSRRYQKASELKFDVESVSRGDGSYRRKTEGLFEYRSKRELFGLPVIHILFSRGVGTGQTQVAKGIIAIGDVAIGGLAVGGVSFGGITLGGLSCGLVSFGGLALALLVALGGSAIGGLAMGGLAVGGIFAKGGADFVLIDLASRSQWIADRFVWLVASAAITALAVGIGWAVAEALTSRQKS